MKKLISVLILATLFISSFTAFAAQKSESDVAALLSELNIMKGDPDGNLRLDDNVSRAEFTKIAVAASAYRNSVAKSLTISPFKDVQYTHWAAPYIKVAVSQGICKGYPDATFNPDGTVVYEEAVTMLLKILGYTDDDFGISWPYGQIGIAEKIDLLEDISKNIGDTMNRRDVMSLVYNLLNTKAKGANTDYIQTMNYRIVEDTVLIATAQEDSSVGSDKVFTSTGVYQINSSFNRDYVGKKGDVVIKNNDELVIFIPSEQNINTYNIYQVLDNEIIVLENGQLKPLDADKKLTVYNKSAKSTLENSLSLISPGDVLTTYRNSNGVLDYGVLKTDEMEGPFTVLSSSWLNNTGLNESNVTIMRDGAKTSLDKVAINDVYYYSKALSTVWCYSNKVTGIYEKALPNKDMPTSIVVSGVTYSIEGANALNKLSSSGSFKYGDTVTLLMGRTKKVADVIGPNSVGGDIYGYLIDTGKKEFTDSDNSKYSGDYVKIVLPDGNAYEYIADRNYEKYVNSVVKITFSNSVAKANIVSQKSDVSSTFDWQSKRLGKSSLSADLEIIDVSTFDNAKSGSYVKVFPQRLDGVEMTSSKIAYAEKNSSNVITKLILNNVTGDTYSYGIVTEVSKSSMGMYISASYTIDIGGTVRTYPSSSLFSIYSDQPAKIKFAENGSPDIIQPLEKIEARVSSVTGSSLTAGSNQYLLSDSVSVYKKSSDYNYTLIPLNEIVNNSNYVCTAYIDKEIKYGGRVRIIIAAQK